MDVRVVPTLEDMAVIYRLPREGGPRSERFIAYLAAVRERDHAGLQAYNPMAGGAALDTVERLLGVQAERLAGESARVVPDGQPEPLELAVVVPAPGLWTDRLITEAEHRLRPDRPRPTLVQMWAGEPVAAADVRREATAEAVRWVWTRAHGPAEDVLAAVTREGVALALSGSVLPPLDPAAHSAVEEAVAILGDSRAWADVLAVAYGDSLADALGLPPLGLPERAGCRYALQQAGRLLDVAGAGVQETPRSWPRSLSSAEIA